MHWDDRQGTHKISFYLNEHDQVCGRVRAQPDSSYAAFYTTEYIGEYATIEAAKKCVEHAYSDPKGFPFPVKGIHYD